MPKKKQRANAQRESDDALSENNDELNEEIMVDFEARSPCDSDYESIKLLLNQKLGSYSLNLGGLGELLIEQNQIGNVIYQAIDIDDQEPVIDNNRADNNDDDDNVIFGILSLVDLKKYKSKSCVQQLCAWLNKEFEKELKKSKASASGFLENVFDKKNIAYLVNERYVNIPPQISIPMVESLLKDLDADKNKPDQSPTHWLILAKSFDNNESDSERIYLNAEEETFKEMADACFVIDTVKDNDGSNVYLEVMFLPVNKINTALEKIKQLIK
jgi:protein BCP1